MRIIVVPTYYFKRCCLLHPEIRNNLKVYNSSYAFHHEARPCRTCSANFWHLPTIAYKALIRGIQICRHRRTSDDGYAPDDEFQFLLFSAAPVNVCTLNVRSNVRTANAMHLHDEDVPNLKKGCVSLLENWEEVRSK